MIKLSMSIFAAGALLFGASTFAGDPAASARTVCQCQSPQSFANGSCQGYQCMPPSYETAAFCSNGEGGAAPYVIVDPSGQLHCTSIYAGYSNSNCPAALKNYLLGSSPSPYSCSTDCTNWINWHDQGGANYTCSDSSGYSPYNCSYSRSTDGVTLRDNAGNSFGCGSSSASHQLCAQCRSLEGGGNNGNSGNSSSPPSFGGGGWF